MDKLREVIVTLQQSDWYKKQRELQNNSVYSAGTAAYTYTNCETTSIV